MELGPGVEVEPTKLANALDAKDEGGNVTDDSVGLGLNQYLYTGLLTEEGKRRGRTVLWRWG